MQIKLIFTRRVLHLADTWPHFESEGFWESDVAYSYQNMTFSGVGLGLTPLSSKGFLLKLDNF